MASHWCCIVSECTLFHSSCWLKIAVNRMLSVRAVSTITSSCEWLFNELKGFKFCDITTYGVWPQKCQWTHLLTLSGFVLTFSLSSVYYRKWRIISNLYSLLLAMLYICLQGASCIQWYNLYYWRGNWKLEFSNKHYVIVKVARICHLI